MSDADVSKRLAYVLRHRPDSIGVELDAAGWVRVDTLLVQLAAHGLSVSEARMRAVVEAPGGKTRFAFNGDQTRVRALQGHSVEVALDHPECVPPDVLFHGTVERFVPSIQRVGLRPQARHDVHLSADLSTAVIVARRRGEPVVFEVLYAQVVRPVCRSTSSRRLCSTGLETAVGYASAMPIRGAGRSLTKRTPSRCNVSITV